MAPARATAGRPPAPDANWTAARLAAAVAANGFVLIGASAMRGLMGNQLSSAAAATFARSWDDLPRDQHMADGGRYRRRRHAVYVAEGGELRRQPDQPHYQSLAHNPLNGGIARWFAPVRADVGESPILRAAIDLLVSVAGCRRGPAGRWRVEVHQFRIEARTGEAGRPTPEGMHRDGVDFVLVMLIGRRNAAQGVSTLADPAGRPLANIQLSEPFEAMILDDEQVRHGVSPIEPADRARPAARDALVVTLKALGPDPESAREPGAG
jgi:hypothetical protein